MGKTRYYFPFIAPGTFMRSVAVQAKILMEQMADISVILSRYEDNSTLQTPSQILYLMSQHNESLFELKECEIEPVSEVKSSPESLSPGKRRLNLKRKDLASDDSTEPAKEEAESLPVQQADTVGTKKKCSSTITKASDMIPSTSVQPLESTSTCMEEAAIMSTSHTTTATIAKTSQKDVNPDTCTQGSVVTGEKGQMAEKLDSGDPAKEFKEPIISVQEEQEEPKPAKRQKLSHSSVADTPEYTSPGKKAETVTSEDKMDISPDKSDKMSPSKDGAVAISPVKSQSPPKFGSPSSSIQILEGGIVEIDMPSASEENLASASNVCMEDVSNLVDDPSRVEGISKEVEDRVKASIPPKKTKADLGTLEKRRSSPRLAGKTNSPKNTSSPDSESGTLNLLSHPNVLIYLKLKFKSVLSHRNKYMNDIHAFFIRFSSDVNFLYFHSVTLLTIIEIIRVDKAELLTDSVQYLKGRIMRNAREYGRILRPLIHTVELDIPFWCEGLNEIRQLNEANEPLLAEGNDSPEVIESLRKYESSLRSIWERMDKRILQRNRLKSTIFEISNDFRKLTKDFGRYLIAVELMRPWSCKGSDDEL